MKGIGPGLCHHVDDAASEAAIFGIHVARKDAELRNRVEIRDDTGLLADGLLHACAVEVVGVVGLTLAMNGKLTCVGFAGCGYRAESAAGAGIARAAGRYR